MIFQAELITLHNNGDTIQILMSPLSLQSQNPLAEIKMGVIDKLHLYRNWVNDAYIAGLYEGYLPAGYKANDELMLYGDDIKDYYLGYIHIDNENKSYRIPEEQTEHIELLNHAGEAFYSAAKESKKVTVMKATKPSDLKVGRI